MPVLDDAQLFALTLRRRSAAQRKVLDAIRVPYRVRPDNSLVVFVADMETADPSTPKIKPRTWELHLDA